MACLGSLYPLCTTTSTNYSCNDKVSLCTNPYYNILQGCNYTSSNNSLINSDPQCNQTFLITKDFVSNEYARTISITLSWGQMCPIYFVNMIADGSTAIFRATVNNIANITYLLINNTNWVDSKNFNDPWDFDMSRYSLMNQSD